MKRELKISVPEGYEIDEENSTFECIKFKKKNNMPKTWEDYCNLQVESWSPNLCGNIILGGRTWNFSMPSEKTAKAFLAYSRIMQIYFYWIKDWKPNMDSFYPVIIKIAENGKSELTIDEALYGMYPLTFPTEEMRDSFSACFNCLLEDAKMFL